MRLIILPQALRLVIPAIVGLFILVIAQVMDIGRELQEADKLTI